MDLGLIGLGKMGGNMRERIRRAGHTVVGYDRNPDVSDVDSLEAMVDALPSPKVVWVMVPGRRPDPGDRQGAQGAAVRGRRHRRRRQLALDRRQGQRRAPLRQGHRLRRLRRLRRRLGPGERLRPDGRRRRRRTSRSSSRSSTRSSPRASSAGCTPARSAPGTSPRWSTTASSTPSCSRTPRAGSCSGRSTRSTTSPRCSAPGARARSSGPGCSTCSSPRSTTTTPCPRSRGYAEDSGEGRWTVEAGIDNAVATPAITAALYARFVSRQDDSPAMKAVAAMRNQFGGHATRTSAPPGGDKS